MRLKNIALTALLALASSSVIAQQKNVLLQNDFWKQNPSLDLVKEEISKGNDPAQADQRLMDPTSLAINSGASLDVIKYLVAQKGNGVAKATHHSRTYLHWAAAKGNVELVKYLISIGADLNKGDSYGTPSVAYAASTGQANAAVYDAFFKTPAAATKKYANGASLLLLGIAGDKDFKLTDYLISKGLSIKDVDNDGASAFDYAAKSGNIELLKQVMAKGAKPTSQAIIFASQGGRNSAASLAVYKYLVEDLKLNPLVVSKDGVTPLHNVVRKANQADVIAYFLAKGVDVNKANEEGNTPFLNAAGGRDIAVLEMLLPKVKSINYANKKGETALALALSSSSPEMVSYLINKGANVNVLDAAGNNLAYYLIQGYRPAGRPAPNTEGTPKDEFAEKLQMLTAKGLNVKAAQKDGNTLYHLAIANLDVDLLKKITDLKVDVNAKNKEGLTVLHRAALISKDDKVLKYLLSAGADKGIKTEFGETTFDLAAENTFLTNKKIAVDFLK